VPGLQGSHMVWLRLGCVPQPHGSHDDDDDDDDALELLEIVPGGQLSHSPPVLRYCPGWQGHWPLAHGVHEHCPKLVVVVPCSRREISV